MDLSDRWQHYDNHMAGKHVVEPQEGCAECFRLLTAEVRRLRERVAELERDAAARPAHWLRDVPMDDED